MKKFVILACAVLWLLPAVGMAQESQGAYVQRMVFSEDIQGREPVKIGDTFSNCVGRVYCYTKFIGVDEPATYSHVWYRNGVQLSQIELDVLGVTWRTWSYKTIVKDWVGTWRVDVVAPDGRVIASRSFNIVETR